MERSGAPRVDGSAWIPSHSGPGSRTLSAEMSLSLQREASDTISRRELRDVGFVSDPEWEGR